MSKIAILGDLHFGVKKGDEKMATYFSRFLSDVFFPEIDKRGINHIIQLGDMFDPRSEIATHVFDQVNDSLITPIMERGCRFDMILGNHDTRYKNTNSINTPSVLFGVKLGSGGTSLPIEDTDYGKLVIDDVYEFQVGKTKIALVPWLSHENESHLIERIKTTDANVVMGHFEIVGAKMDRFNVAKHGLSQSMFNRFDMVLSGHFHHRSDYGNIHYVGTPYEMTWIDCDDPKGFYILDTDTLDMEFIRNPITMFNKIVYDGKTHIDPEPFRGTNVRLVIENHDDPVAVNRLFASFEDVTNDVTVIDNTKAVLNTEVESGEDDLDTEAPENTLQVILDMILSSIPVDNEEMREIATNHVNQLYRNAVL